MGGSDGDSPGATVAHEREPNLLDAALSVAAQAHAGQSRPDGSPYLGHPLRVCELLSHAGESAPTLAAALLHDAVEDSELRVGDVVERFGVEIGELVAALTDDESIADWAERKDALRAQVAEAGPAAAAIYAADKLANIEELARLYEREGEAAAQRLKAPSLDARVRAWQRDSELARARVAHPQLARALSAELAAFEALRRERLAGQEASARG